MLTLCLQCKIQWMNSHVAFNRQSHAWKQRDTFSLKSPNEARSTTSVSFSICSIGIWMCQWYNASWASSPTSCLMCRRCHVLLVHSWLWKLLPCIPWHQCVSCDFSRASDTPPSVLLDLNRRRERSRRPLEPGIPAFRRPANPNSTILWPSDQLS